MKALLEEISDDAAISGLQVSDSKGTPVVAHFQNSIDSPRRDKLGGLIRELEDSTEQNLFKAEGFELEFDDMQLVVAKANSHTVALLANSEVQSDTVHSYVERIKDEIESRPESEWLSEFESTVPEPENTPEPQQEKTESAQAKPVAAVPVSKAASDALSALEKKPEDDISDEDLIDKLDIDPKQKAILKIQQKALLDAKKRSQEILLLKQNELRSLAEDTQAKVDNLNAELAKEQEVIDQKISDRETLAKTREKAVADRGKLKLEIKGAEDAKSSFDGELKAKLEQESLRQKQEVQSIQSQFEKKKEFTHSKIAMARKEAEKLSASVTSSEGEIENAEESLKALPAKQSKKLEAVTTQLNEAHKSEVSRLQKTAKSQSETEQSKGALAVKELKKSAQAMREASEQAAQATKEIRSEVEKRAKEFAATEEQSSERIKELRGICEGIEKAKNDRLEAIDDAFVESEKALLNRKQEQDAVIAQKDLEEEELRLEFERRLKAIQDARDEARGKLAAVSEEQAKQAEKAEEDRLEVTIDAEEKTENASKEITSIESIQSEAKKKLEAIQQRLAANEKEETLLGDQANKAQKALDDKELEINETVAMIQKDLDAALATAKANYEKDLSAAEAANTQETKALQDQMEAAIKAAEKQVHESKEALEKVRLEIGENLTLVKEEESQLLAKKQAASDDYEARIKELRDETQNRVHEKNNELEALYKKVESKDQEENKLLAQEDQAQAEIAELEGRLEELGTEYRSKITKLEDRLATLKAEVDEAEAEVSLMADAIRSSLEPYLGQETIAKPEPAPAKEIEPEVVPEPETAQAPEPETAPEAPQINKVSSGSRIFKLPSSGSKTTKIPKKQNKSSSNTLFGRRAKKEKQKDEEDDIWG